jgi:NAD+ diphosphatase
LCLPEVGPALLSFEQEQAVPFIYRVDPPPALEAAGPWFAYRGTELLVRLEDGQARVPVARDLSELGLSVVRSQYLGELDGAPCRSAELAADAKPPDGWTCTGLRSLFAALPEDSFRLAGRAFQVVEWERTSLFCGRCGSATRPRSGERARECPSCGNVAWPRITPAIIVSVTRGDEILLARHHRFSQRFTVIAGFVEPGETLEECVEREVHEEVGIDVADVRYVASQSWPFPGSLMVGFTAAYAGGEITVDATELIEARWFPADSLPQVPDPITIARRLIDGFVASRRPR